MASSVWAGSELQEAYLARLLEQARNAKQRGQRPRLALFDFPHRPCFGSLRRLAESLHIHVQIEPLVEESEEEFLARLRLLEKTRGLHGVLFPDLMTPARWSLVENSRLRDLNLDGDVHNPSPQVLSFIQLSEARSWSTRNRRALILCSPSTRRIGQSLESQLQRLGLRTERFENEVPFDLWWYDLVWLASEEPVRFKELHLNPETVLVDSGSAYSLPPALSSIDQRLALTRQSGWCPPVGGLGPLVNLNRLSRLLRVASGRKGNLRPGAKTEPR